MGMILGCICGIALVYGIPGAIYWLVNLFLWMERLLGLEQSFSPIVVWAIFGALAGLFFGLSRGALLKKTGSLAFLTAVVPFLMLAGLWFLQDSPQAAQVPSAETSVEKPKLQLTTVIVTVGNVRENSSKNSKKLFQVQFGDTLEVRGRYGNWYYIRETGGQRRYGCVYKSLIDQKGLPAYLKSP